MKLNDRMARVDFFGDGRLHEVSREARLLAITLESLADPTGVVPLDAGEIRAVAGMFLADSDGVPPKSDVIDGWINELVDTGWVVRYHHGSAVLGYLKGFGGRQKGQNVCIGVSETGVIADHLPLPPCVTLERAKSKAGEALPKLLPEHCTEHRSMCPCERISPSAPPPDTHPTPTRGRKGTKENGRDASELDSDAKESQLRGGDAGEGTDDPDTFLADLDATEKERKEVKRLFQLLLPSEIADVVRLARQSHNSNPKRRLVEFVTFYAEASVQMTQPDTQTGEPDF